MSTDGPTDMNSNEYFYLFHSLGNVIWVDCGSTVKDSITQEYHVHRYEFTAPVTAITFDSCETEQLDTIIRILDSNEVEQFVNDDHSGQCANNNVASHIDASGLEIGATYFLEVRAYDTDVGEYQISLECSSKLLITFA